MRMPKYNPFLIVRVRLDGLAGFEVVLSRCIFGEKSDSDRFRTKSSPKVTFKGSFDGDDGPPGGGGELRPSSCCSSLWIPSPWMTASFTRRRSAKLNIKLWQLWFCTIVISHDHTNLCARFAWPGFRDTTTKLELYSGNSESSRNKYGDALSFGYAIKQQ